MSWACYEACVTLCVGSFLPLPLD